MRIESEGYGNMPPIGISLKWVRSNPDALPIIEVLASCQGMKLSQLQEKTAYDRYHLLSLLSKLRNYGIIDSGYITNPKTTLDWFVPVGAYDLVSRILMLEGSKTTSKMVAEVA